MKKCLMFIGFLFISYLSIAQGPLTGTLVINKGEIEKKWDDKIEYEFNVKNSGTKAIDILKVTGACDCQSTYASNIQTIQANHQERQAVAARDRGRQAASAPDRLQEAEIFA
jgi:hypothetical protein